MGLIGKSSLIVGAALFCGASLALWLGFGGGVYANYLSGVLMNCF